MCFRVLLQLLKLRLQFCDRLFEVEVMFHRGEISLSIYRWQCRFGTGKEPDLHPALSGDEVYTPSPRRSEGWCGQLFARCSNRTTSKTSILTLNEQRNLLRSTCLRYSKSSAC